MLVSLRTASGEQIDLSLPEELRIRDLKNILREEFNYPSSVNIMFSTKIIHDDARVDDFPPGSLVVVGARMNDNRYQQANPPVPTHRDYAPPPQAHHNSNPYSLPRQGHPPSRSTAPGNAHPYVQMQTPGRDQRVPQSQPRAGHGRFQTEDERLRGEVYGRSPTYSSPAGSHPTQAPAPAQEGSRHNHNNTSYGGRSPPPQNSHHPSSSSASSPSSHGHGQHHFQYHHTSRGHSPSTTPRRGAAPTEPAPTASPQDEMIEITALIPALEGRTVTLTINNAQTVDDLIVALVAKEPAVAGCKLMFYDKYIPSGSMPLRAVPLSNGSEICVASGPFLNPHEMTLYRVERDYKRVATEVSAAGEAAEKNQKKFWGEQLMKGLLKLDSIQDAEESIRLRRKVLVRTITALQDALQ